MHLNSNWEYIGLRPQFVVICKDFQFTLIICVLASTRNPHVTFVSYKSQVTAFPELLWPNHIIEVVMKSQY